tara:strand:- start:357 stop:947 length:591 start_codon:yes stop_codon:yes gene_type:complete
MDILRHIAQGINAQVLNESSHNFKPFGDSSALLIQANTEVASSGTMHLNESHITYHTYIETRIDNFFLIRLEIHVCSCTRENVFSSLKYLMNNKKSLFKNFMPEVITLDYLKRGCDINSNDKNVSPLLHDEFFDFSKNYNKIININSSNTLGCNHFHYLIMRDSLIEKLTNIHKDIELGTIDLYYSVIKDKYCSYH